MTNPPEYRSNEIAQASIVASWEVLEGMNKHLPLEEVGFQCFSEFEEDGMLLYLFTVLGHGNRTVVEISSQDGRVCMASNLIVHHRWRGFLYDADERHVKAGSRFFGKHPATRSFPPSLNARWFDRDNIGQVLQDDGVPDDVDLLSLDIDGVDLYLWDALKLRPRVLLCEFNNAVPIDSALTVPYDAQFRFDQQQERHAFFRSASLKAYDTVCRAKGYRYVGCNALGFNAFFLRDDVGIDRFPARDIRDIERLPFVKHIRSECWPALQSLPWVDLDTEEGRASFRSLS